MKDKHWGERTLERKFTIKRIVDTERRAFIHCNHKETLGLHHLKKVNIRLGLQVCDINVSFSSDIKINEIILTSKVVDVLLLPLFPLYEIRFKENELQLGPCIGILAAKNREELAENVMKLGRYVRKYKEIGGVIVAFSSDSVNTEKRTITGYVYDYTKKQWKKGEYPYPLAIFRKSYLPYELKLHFQSVLGDRIFNSSKFDKWEMYEWLKEFEHLYPFLPETSLYESSKDIEPLLTKYQAVYVKPIKGMQGKRVAKIEIKANRIVIQMIIKGEKEDYYFDSLIDAGDFVQKNFTPKKYIVQQSLNLHLKSEVIVDFRVILVKDQSGEWKNYGIIGRSGLPGNIVSNRHRGGKIEMAEQTLATIFLEAKAVDYLNKMERVAIDTALAIEQCGLHFGKLGIDIGIDIDGNLWVIEINHRNPNDFVATFAGNKNLVNKIRLANLLYAKRIAGFD